MTLTLKNNDALALIPGGKTRRSLFAVLLIGVGLLLGGFQSAFAQISYNIVSVKQNSVANSGIYDVVTVHLNPPGNIGVPLTFKYLGGQQTVTTDANGDATFSYGYANPGTVPIDIYFGALKLTTYPFNYIAAPGPVSPTHSYVIQVITPKPADGSSQDLVVARLFDVDGNSVNTVSTEVRFSLANNPGDIVPTMSTNHVPPGPVGSAMTSGDGTGSGNEANAYFTSTAAGNANVNAAIFDAGSGTWIIIPNLAGNYIPAPINFTALAADPTKSYFTVTTDNSPDNNSTPDIVTAYLFDKLGNPVTDGTTVNFSIDPGNSIAITNKNNTLTGNCTTGTVQSQYISPAPGSGKIEATFTLADGTIYTLYDAAPGVYPPTTTPPNPFVVAHFVSGPADPSKSYILVTTNKSPDDNSTPDIITVYLLDAQGYPVTGTTQVNFGNPSGPATIVNASMSSQTVTGSSTTSQYICGVTTPTTTVVVTINGNPLALNDQSAGTAYGTLIYINTAVSWANSYIVVTHDNSIANNNDQDIVTAYLFDQNNQPITDGTQVTFNQVNGIGNLTPTLATASPVGCTTGSVTAGYKSSKTGSAGIEADVAGLPQPLQERTTGGALTGNLYGTIHFVSDVPSLQNSYIVTTTDNQAVTTGQDIVTVYLFDANNNPVDNGTYTIVFQPQSGQPVGGGSGSITVNASSTVNSGTQSFTSTAAGTFPVVSATWNGSPIKNQGGTSTTVSVTFVAGPPVTGNPGGPGGGNPGGGNPGGGSPGGGNNGGGGSGGGGSTDPGPNGGYTHEYVLESYNFRLADGFKQDSVYVLVTDGSATPNPIANYDVTFFFSTSPNVGTITSGANIVGSSVLGTITVKTNQYGIAAIAVTSTTDGTLWIGAKMIDPKTSLLTEVDLSPQMITFLTSPDVTNPLTALTTVIYEALADGKQQTEVKAHIVDTKGDKMPNQAVYFTIDSGTATIVTAQPAYTDAEGDAYIFIISQTPGDVKITATVDDKKIIFGSPAPVHFAPINIYVPRVFTPNNDGTNDILKPILVGIAQFHYFSIYNRWGNLIFTTQDANQGWDGTFRGVPQPVETYLWIGEGIDTNGKKIVQRGMVSLVR
jgi:gliding motility-associated-like protein